MLIIARKNGRCRIWIANVLKIPAIAAALKRIHVEGVQDIAIRKIGTKKFFEKFLESFPIRANSDYHPVLDQNAARARFIGEFSGELIQFYPLPLPTLEMLTGSGLSAARDKAYSFLLFLKVSDELSPPWPFVTTFSPENSM